MCSTLYLTTSVRNSHLMGRHSCLPLHFRWAEGSQLCAPMCGHRPILLFLDQNLADSGVVFTRAYCAIAVCSPSRMSFLTGRLVCLVLHTEFMMHEFAPLALLPTSLCSQAAH